LSYKSGSRSEPAGALLAMRDMVLEGIYLGGAQMAEYIKL
jgi:hypothetical protein